MTVIEEQISELKVRLSVCEVNELRNRNLLLFILTTAISSTVAAVGFLIYQ